MLCLLAKTMCGRTQLMMPRADPEEGAGVRTPAPWKITYSIGLYRNMQLDPSPCEKLDPLEMLDRPSPWILESYGLMIVFFEKAMITRLPLQNKLRTYNKNEEKKTSELFSVSRDWTRHRPIRRKFPGSANGYTLSWW